MALAFWILSALVGWISFLAVCLAAWVAYKLLTGKPIL